MARPLAGVGISLRREHYDALLTTPRTVDWLEIQPENFMSMGGRARHVLAACRERWPVVPHGVSLSLGGPDPLSCDYLAHLATLMAELDAPYFSEHASFSAAGGVQFHELMPLPFSEEAADHLATRTREVARRLACPMVLENITYYAQMPGSGLDEGAFLTSALEQADAGLLLDVNNVYVNAKNHGIPVQEALDALPLHRAVQIHLAGHRRDGDWLIDDHGSAVSDPVWELYRDVVRRLGPLPTLIEWENGVPPLDGLLDEVDRARAILAEVGATSRPNPTATAASTASRRLHHHAAERAEA